MPIRTDIATHYFWRQMITAIICLVLAVWGAYDLWVKIPAQEKAVERFSDVEARLDALQAKVDGGATLNEEEQAQYEELERQASSPPVPPSTFDKFVQWMFISCILGVPWCLWSIYGLKSRNYELDEEGNLTLASGATWTRDEIAGIDMSRWMAKSIAHVEHTDGRREKLDAAHPISAGTWSTSSAALRTASSRRSGLSRPSRLKRAARSMRRPRMSMRRNRPARLKETANRPHPRATPDSGHRASTSLGITGIST